MWIRSQDKTILLKSEIVEYCYQLEKISKELKDKKGKPIYFLGRPAEEIVGEKEHHYICVNGIKCAKYSSEEKALKVLDMIEEQIDYYSEENFSSTFQMPQDDEVE